MDEIEALLTTRQLQRLLQVDRITIYRMLQDGRLEGFKVGGQWRFSRESIEKWLQERQADLDVAKSPAAEDLTPSSKSLPLYCMHMIQDIVAELLGVGVVTTSLDGVPLTPLDRSGTFCRLVLGTDAGRARCIGSWQAATDQPCPASHPVTCHAGLHYVWGCAKVQGQYVAATYAGQFLVRPLHLDEDWTERLRELGAAIGVDAGDLEEALAQVPVLDAPQQEQLMRLLQRLTTTFSEMGEERLNLLSRLERIAEISSL